MAKMRLFMRRIYARGVMRARLLQTGTFAAAIDDIIHSQPRRFLAITTARRFAGFVSRPRL